MKKVLFLALASIMMLMVACDKEEGQNTPTHVLVGTTWHAYLETTNEEADEYTLIDKTVTFTTVNTGTSDTHYKQKVNGHITSKDYKTSIDYTFDGTNDSWEDLFGVFNFTLVNDTLITIQDNDLVFTKM